MSNKSSICGSSNWSGIYEEEGILNRVGLEPWNEDVKGGAVDAETSLPAADGLCAAKVVREKTPSARALELPIGNRSSQRDRDCIASVKITALAATATASTVST